jgi:formylglycine-generating enzyme required for sulfatase activity
VWEWCDSPGPDPDIPGERSLRGGSHQNWDLHCTCGWRYGIAPDAHDQFIGFRLAI